MVGLVNKPMINGVVYAWSSIKINVMGETLTGVDAINYEEDQAIEGVYGAGNRKIGVSYGDVETPGSITLQRHEIDRLEDLSSTGRLQDLPPFEIIVSYTAGGRVKVHTLEFVIIKKNIGGGSKGENELSKELDLFIGNIKWK
jgi:protein involved in ribonucleotide reduction